LALFSGLSQRYLLDCYPNFCNEGYIDYFPWGLLSYTNAYLIFRKSDHITETFQNFVTKGLTGAWIHVLLPDFAEIDKAEVTKWVHGIYHEKGCIRYVFFSRIPCSFVFSFSFSCVLIVFL